MTTGSCLITGASRGLGEELAHAFHRSGWKVFLVARSASALEHLANDLRGKRGSDVGYADTDIAEPGAAARIVSTVKSTYGALDVLINNAAVQGPIGPAWRNSSHEWQRTLDVNLMAPVAFCQAAASVMVQQNGGTIINISGGGATSPRANFSAYATSKAGLVRFTETLAEELRPYRVNVNCVAPGAMPTAMLRAVLEAGESATGSRERELAERAFRTGITSMDRVTELCLLLASERGHAITGKLISAVWDNWQAWPDHSGELASSDVYTLRRITGRDRGLTWGDK